MNGKNAFRYITDDPITLELTGCGSVGEVHERIKEAFGFPDYYGKNWDAMWDCIDFLFDQREIVIRGFQTMPRMCGNTAGLCWKFLKICMRRIRKSLTG